MPPPVPSVVHPAAHPLRALVVGPGGGVVLGEGVDERWPADQVVARLAEATAAASPRWVVWSAASTLAAAVAARVDVPRTWDLAEAHRLLHGGWWATPGHVVAACRGLPEHEVPRTRPGRQGFEGDLFDVVSAEASSPFVEGGHLRPDALEWATTPERLRQLAELALECQQGQARALAATAVGADRFQQLERTVWSESAAAVLCLELERDGLPVDRATAEQLVAAAAGPRPSDEADAARIRERRDEEVLRHALEGTRADLRNPTQVRALLRSVGVDVASTRAHVLEPYRQTHPLVDALLRWRKDERIATTYGYRWLDVCVGPDDRLRGTWTASDGAAGRMTAQNGLHNLPAPLRPAVRAADGHVFVRADLGQVEPRVLAVVSGDRAFAEATRADDLYAPVAAKLGADRPTAKVAVLAAMYGQRSGPAGEALKDLERAYPVAMRLLDRAYADGVGRRPVRTFGGRLIRFGAAGAPGSSPDLVAADGARGRYARNAVIQGSAAELFKAWAATVRAAVAPIGGQIVLCLHDELLVHVPEQHADEAARRVGESLERAARTWAGTDAVRFVSDTSVVRRWSDAKS